MHSSMIVGPWSELKSGTKVDIVSISNKHLLSSRFQRDFSGMRLTLSNCIHHFQELPMAFNTVDKGT